MDFADPPGLSTGDLDYGLVGLDLDHALVGFDLVAFFDKDKRLIGVAGRTFFAVAPGKQELVTYPIGLPADVADRVASYQITLYEGEKQVGQK